MVQKPNRWIIKSFIYNINSSTSYNLVITLKKQEITIINDAAWVGYEISLGLEEKDLKVNYLPRNKSGPNIKTNYIRSTYDKLFPPVKNAI